MEKDELVAWSRIKDERRDHTITKLLHVVEESALSLGNSYKTPAELEIKATEMGEAFVCAECLYGLRSNVRLSNNFLPHVCRNLQSSTSVTFFFFLSSTTELKLFTFEAHQIKAKLSVSMGGDHINLTPKLKPEEERNGKRLNLCV